LIFIPQEAHIEAKEEFMTIPPEDTIVDHFILIYRPEHHRAYPAGYVPEQILVAEGHLGRELMPSEEVKHVNGKTRDNRPENLRVTSGSYKFLSLTADVEMNSKAYKTFIPCKYQKPCWNEVRAPIARHNKVFLPYICSYQSDGEVYYCSRFWSYYEKDKEPSSTQLSPSL
jgi:hypothetical protein